MNRRGFTLLEVLLVVAIIAILAGIVILAINPNKQLGETRNAQRQTDVNTILNGVYQYSLDNDGTLPSGITTAFREICATNAATCTGLADISDITDDETYLVAIPIDPQGATSSVNGTGYYITLTSGGRVTVSAPAALDETSATSSISVTR